MATTVTAASLPEASSVNLTDLLVVYSVDDIEQHLTVADLLRSVRGLPVATGYSPTDEITMVTSAGVLFKCYLADLFPLLFALGISTPRVTYGVGWDNCASAGTIAAITGSDSAGGGQDFQGLGANHQNFAWSVHDGYNPDASEILRVGHLCDAFTTARHGFIGRMFTRNEAPVCFARHRKTVNSYNSKLWFGFSSIDPGVDNGTTGWSSSHMAAWFVPYGESYWKVITADGTNLVTHLTTGIAWNDADPHYMKIEFADDGGSVDFYYDGVLIHTATTNLPAAGVMMQCLMIRRHADIVGWTVPFVWARNKRPYLRY